MTLRTPRTFANIAAFVLLAFARASARAGVAESDPWSNRWHPPDVSMAPVATEGVVARARAAMPADAAQTKAYRITVRGSDAVATFDAITRGSDVRFATSIGAAEYAMGRTGGVRWRRTPNGIEHVVRSDVQGDDLDRWPIAPFAPAWDTCTAIGTSRSNDVLACRDGSGEARFLYVLPSGRIEREAVREGSRVTTFAFHLSDDGSAFPAGWSIAGAGGAAEVTVERVDREIGDAPFRQPDRAVSPFVTTVSSAVRIGSIPPNNYPMVDVVVNGQKGRFLLDDGTPQIVIDADFARRSGIASAFGHGIADRIDAGPIHGTAVAVRTMPLFCDGILGFEFFLGNVIHVNYGNGSVELIPNIAFSPPPNARAVPVDVSEGMPVVAGVVGDVAVSRLVPDLGSVPVVFPRFLRDTQEGNVRLHAAGPRSTVSYLEGPITLDLVGADTFGIGPFLFHDVATYAEVPNANDIEIPLDGIVGSDVLFSFELWFDYDAGRLYLRHR